MIFLYILEVIKPGYLLFTAPYRLCEGECKTDKKNFVLSFPMYVGNKGIEIYRGLFNRDLKKIHHSKPKAPFKRKTTKSPVTYCPTQIASKTIETTPISTTEAIFPITMKSESFSNYETIDPSMKDDSNDRYEDNNYFLANETIPSTTNKEISYIATGTHTETTAMATFPPTTKEIDFTNYLKCPEVSLRFCMKKTTKVKPINTPNEKYFYNYYNNPEGELRKGLNDEDSYY